MVDRYRDSFHSSAFLSNWPNEQIGNLVSSLSSSFSFSSSLFVTLQWGYHYQTSSYRPLFFPLILFSIDILIPYLTLNALPGPSKKNHHETTSMVTITVGVLCVLYYSFDGFSPPLPRESVKGHIHTISTPITNTLAFPFFPSTLGNKYLPHTILLVHSCSLILRTHSQPLQLMLPCRTVVDTHFVNDLFPPCPILPWYIYSYSYISCMHIDPFITWNMNERTAEAGTDDTYTSWVGAFIYLLTCSGGDIWLCMDRVLSSLPAPPPYSFFALLTPPVSFPANEQLGPGKYVH